MNHYYRGGAAPRYERIDQEDVPESKHTVFIRGLPGHLKTDEVKLVFLRFFHFYIKFRLIVKISINFSGLK